MSMYGVNAGVPKTLVRYLVRYEALRGKMIDAPIAARARQTLAAAEEILAEGGTLQ